MSAMQRNSSYNPQVARARRIVQQREAEKRIQAENREARKSQLREHGRKLDQIEQCYREHAPAQIHHADAMRRCGDFTDVDAAYDAGQIMWQDDCLAIVGS